jgi:putative ABC transport system permease protein
MGVDMAGKDRLVVRHKVSLIQMLPESYEARIEQIDGVQDATFATWFGGIYQDPKNFFGQFPVKPDEFMAMYPELVLPADQMDAWKRTRTGCVVGRKIADKYGFRIGDKIPLQATIWRPKTGGETWTFDVVGIYDGATKETDTTMFLFRYDYFNEMRAMGEGMVGWYYIRVKDSSRAAEIARKVDDLFANSPYETKTETEGAFMKAFAEQAGNIGAIVTAIVTAVFFTILLVVGNTMAQAVRERTRELGVLKAIGFSDAKVLGIVLIESCMIALVGGSIGLALAWQLISLGDPTGGALPIFFFPIDDVAKGIVLIFVLGIAAGALPALQAMRLNAVDALRRE